MFGFFSFPFQRHGLLCTCGIYNNFDFSKRLFLYFLKQGSHIRIYNVDKRWKVQKNILAKSLRWTVTDTSLSPDQRHLVSLYSISLSEQCTKLQL